jgi:1,4-dihydroxy-2-naphthoate octaprenyltransferase
MWAVGVTGRCPWPLLTWLTLLVARPTVIRVLRSEGRILNEALAGTARVELVYAVLFSLGLFLSR